MTLSDLYALIARTLMLKGLRPWKGAANGMSKSRFVASDSDLAPRKVDPAFGYEAIYGVCLEVDEVSRRNGARYNTSYRLSITRYERSRGKAIRKIKLKCDQTEATLKAKVMAFADLYAEAALESAVDLALKDRLN